VQTGSGKPLVPLVDAALALVFSVLM